MPVSGIHSGQQIMQLSHKMADKAAHEIQQTFVKGGEDLSFNKVELAKKRGFRREPFPSRTCHCYRTSYRSYSSRKLQPYWCVRCGKK